LVARVRELLLALLSEPLLAQGTAQPNALSQRLPLMQAPRHPNWL
jgi:hypothetical protein